MSETAKIIDSVDTKDPLDRDGMQYVTNLVSIDLESRTRHTNTISSSERASLTIIQWVNTNTALNAQII